MKLEICCYSVHDALVAAAHGADRIELCSGRSDGGLTPSYGELLQASQADFDIPVHPIVRPRGGDFCYNTSEIQSMLNDILKIKEFGFSGVVIGCLDINGLLDLTVMKKLIHAANGLSITFHRAFDVCKDPFVTMQQLADLGVERILTSGQQATAEKGIALLTTLQSQNQKPIIMAGSGVNSDNISLFIAAGLQEFHASASKKIDSTMQYRNPNVYMSQHKNDEFALFQIDANEVNKMKQQVIE